jgi:hypothetical protein
LALCVLGFSAKASAYATTATKLKSARNVLLAVASSPFWPPTDSLTRLGPELLFAGFNRSPQSLRLVVPSFSAVQRGPSFRGLAGGRISPAPSLLFFGRRTGSVLVQRRGSRRGSGVSLEGEVVGIYASASHLVSIITGLNLLWRFRRKGSRMRHDRRCLSVLPRQGAIPCGPMGERTYPLLAVQSL